MRLCTWVLYISICPLFAHTYEPTKLRTLEKIIKTHELVAILFYADTDPRIVPLKKEVELTSELEPHFTWVLIQTHNPQFHTIVSTYTNTTPALFFLYKGTLLHTDYGPCRLHGYYTCNELLKYIEDSCSTLIKKIDTQKQNKAPSLPYALASGVGSIALTTLSVSARVIRCILPF